MSLETIRVLRGTDEAVEIAPLVPAEAAGPALAAGGHLHRTKLYGYVVNDPVTLIDRNGQYPGGITAQADEDAARAFPHHYNVQDAYRHCLGACYAALRYGQEIANDLGAINEMVGDTVFGQTPAERDKDFYNNACGFREANRSRVRPDCQQACAGALLRGELQSD